MSDPDDVLLIRWTTQRDAEAFQEIVSRHVGMVFGVCRRILGNASDAEDAAQECFEALARAGARPGPFLGAWLHRVAANAARQRLRSERRRKHRERHYARQQPSIHQPGWDDIYGCVDEAVAELPDDLRALIVAHFLESQPRRALAQRAGLTRQAVDYRIKRGVERIRASLERRGIPVAVTALGAMLAANTADAAPATLMATLGKLALSGQLGVPAAGAGSAAAWSGSAAIGGIAMKTKIAVALAAALIAGGGLLMAIESPSVPPPSPGGDVPQMAADTSGANAEVPQEPEPEAPTPPTAALVWGTVSDSQGKPMPGVRVYGVPFSGSHRIGGIESGPGDGAFVVEHAPPGQYRFSAEKRDLHGRKYALELKSPASVSLAAGDEREIAIVIDTHAQWTITGRVLNEEGQPVAGALVMSHLKGTRSRSSTDEGLFEVCAVPADIPEVEVEVQHRDYFRDRFLVSAEDPEVDLVLAAKPRALCRVVVTDALTGDLIPTAEVRWGNEGPWVPTQDGILVTDLATDYVHNIYSRAPGYQETVSWIDIQEDQDNTVEAVLGPATELHLYVDLHEALKKDKVRASGNDTIAGWVEGGLQLYARVADAAQQTRPTRTDDDKAVFEVGRGQTYVILLVLSVRGPSSEWGGRLRVTSEPIAIPQNQVGPVRVRMRLGGDCVLKGTTSWEVLSSISVEGEFVAGAGVAAGDILEPGYHATWTTIRGDDGQFAVYGLESGRYRLNFTGTVPEGEKLHVNEDVEFTGAGQVLELEW